MCHVTPNQHGRRESVVSDLMSEIADLVEKYNKGEMSSLIFLADMRDMSDMAFNKAFTMVSTDWSESNDLTHVQSV